jgi:serine/threonine-protein kinase HipA
MPRCPITLEDIPAGRRYSQAGLRLLDARLKEDLHPLHLTAAEQLQVAAAQADKISIQGIQPKFSAVLRVPERQFKMVDHGGRFILKPCPAEWSEVPANEALTMTLASRSGIDVPAHGLVYAADESLTYFIRRFDRMGRGDKLPVEDFAQLTGQKRDTKYESSMEQVAKVIKSYCTFPAVENVKLARRVIFSFLTGNEDMHLKNFSLVTRDGKVELSPAYDLLNTTIILGKNVKEEIALPVRGKKSNLTRNDLARYFCSERLELGEKVVAKLFQEVIHAAASWPGMIRRSFLSAERQDAYLAVLDERMTRLQPENG